jgi:hypothetical protein
MEPGEKFVKRLLKFVLMIALFIIAIIVEEVAGKGWTGLMIFVMGAVIAGMGHVLWKELKK